MPAKRGSIRSLRNSLYARDKGRQRRMASSADEFDIERGIAYASHDGVALQADVYAPKTAGKYPAIVAVHGGGWQLGSRESYGYWGRYLAARGYVLMAISYRLSAAGKKASPTPFTTSAQRCSSFVARRRSSRSIRPGSR
jgi:acetyl esterase/lipase